MFSGLRVAKTLDTAPYAGTESILPYGIAKPASG